MNTKCLTVLMAFLLFAGMATAATPDVNILQRGIDWDLNGTYLYPNSADITTYFDVSDTDAPTDANIVISLTCDTIDDYYEIIDMNSNTACTDPLSDANQLCTYVIDASTMGNARASGDSLTGVDANCTLNVQVVDITNTDAGDENYGTPSIFGDYNACVTSNSISGDVVTLTRVCTGWGTDTNGGAESTWWTKGRGKGGCPSGFGRYTGDITLAFGEFTVCYHSNDGLGNKETTNSIFHLAGGAAYNIALLSEMLIAAAAILTLLLAYLVSKEVLTVEQFLMMLATMIIAVLMVIIFAAIL